ncbi:MAG: glycosyltransferase family 39 protein [Anaerolineales bacterium]
MYNPDDQHVQEDGEGMSIIDPTGADEAVTPKSNLLFTWVKKYGVYLLLMTIALLRGIAYANLLPPWAIIDEEQHLHYIQVLSEEQRRPDPRNDFLSEELVASLFEAHRWETFGFGTPPAPDPRVMGLEGYSYEGYQPPLYYLLMVPIYRLVQGSMLERLFALRWATVALSSLTIALTYSLANKLSGSKRVAFLAALILLSIPERTVAVSRVNNDALLEIFGALYLWLSLRAIIETPNDRDSVLLGLVLGLGTLTKMTMLPLVIALPFVFYTSHKTYSPRRGLGLSLGSAAVLILPLIFYNLQQFGDITGFGGIAPMLNFPAPVLSVMAFLDSLVRLFIYFWGILWQSARATINPTFTVLYGILFLISCLSISGLRLALRPNPEYEGDRRRVISIWLLITVTIVYAVFTLFSYWRGLVPIVQGRFLLPVTPAIAVLLVLGVRRSPIPSLTISALIVGLLLMDGFILFGHLLPQYYPVDVSSLLSHIPRLSLFSILDSLIQRAGSFKPDFVMQTLHVTIAGYILAYVLVLIIVMIMIRKRFRCDAA